MILADYWEGLSELQRDLKKQFLLVEKEQQEKVKLKRQIEELVRSYHAHSVELMCPGGEVLRDEGFDNCYNFIKDVIITISTNYCLGKLIILLADPSSALPSLVVHGLYENIQTNDIFSKDITRLMHSLLGDLLSPELMDPQRQRIVEAWKLYMQKIQLTTYFEQIAEETLKQLLSQNQVFQSGLKLKKTCTTPSEQRPPKLALSLPFEQLTSAYLRKIELEAEGCLAGIKVPLKALCPSTASSRELKRVWRLLSHFYLAPFLKTAGKDHLPAEARERILRFVDELVQYWGFTSELTFKSVERTEQESGSKVRWVQIQRICGRLLRVGEEERFRDFIADKGPTASEIQIRILGGCVSLFQLFELLVLINSHREDFSRVSEKVISRTVKVFDISPNLAVLQRQRAALQFASLSELRYEESIDSDYYRNYTQVYRGQTLKQMLKHVLVQAPNLRELRAPNRTALSQVFQSLEGQEKGCEGVGLSAQLLMKLRYLVYLLEKEKSLSDEELLRDMLYDLNQRNSVNFKLFENTKFSLLKVYCSLRNLKGLVRHQKEAERRSEGRVKLIRQLQELRLDICITSKASRNRSQLQGDKYRYRMSAADDILVLPTAECIHKDNPFTGRQNHPSSIAKFITAFAGLDELRYYLRHPSFVPQAQQTNPYLYSSQNKFGQALSAFLCILLEKLALLPEQKTIVEEVVFRLLSEALLGTKDQPSIGYYDRCISESRVSEDQTDCESPRKLRESRKRKSSYDRLEWPGGRESWGNREQLHLVGRRYLTSLAEVTSPGDKMRRLRDLVEVYRMAIAKEGKVEEGLLDSLLVRTVASSGVPNLVSQLGYLEMFVAEERLMGSDGKVLKQLQRAVGKVIEEALAVPRESRQ